MMASTMTIAVLNELLVAEQCNPAGRLLESTVFVSDVSSEAEGVVRGMIEATTEHRRALTALIRRLGGEPGPRGNDVMSGDLHFQELGGAVQRVTSGQRRLIALYQRALERLGDEPEAAAVVSQIVEQHRTDLSALEHAACHPAASTG